MRKHCPIECDFVNAYSKYAVSAWWCAAEGLTDMLPYSRDLCKATAIWNGPELWDWANTKMAHLYKKQTCCFFFFSLPEMKPRNLLHASAHSTLVKLSLWSIFSRSESIQGTVKHTRGWLYITVVCFLTEYGSPSLSAMLLKTSFTLVQFEREKPQTQELVLMTLYKTQVRKTEI